jgi:hypothetical protein
VRFRFVERLIRWAAAHPECFIIALTACCLFAFLITIPLPRVDNQLVGSDGVRYYAYLPSLLLDGDLDFTDEYTYFFAHEPGKAERAIEDATPRGLPANQWPIGPAILWAPFFLLAHLLAHFANLLGTSIPTNGYGTFYQAFVLSGSILYSGGGVLRGTRAVGVCERAVLLCMGTTEGSDWGQHRPALWTAGRANGTDSTPGRAFSSSALLGPVAARLVQSTR